MNDALQRWLVALVLILCASGGVCGVAGAAEGDDGGDLGERRDRAQALVKRGQELAAMGRREDALAAFGEALEAYPAYPLAHHEMGVTFAELGNLKEAEASLARALALAPDFMRAHQAMGEVLRRQQRFGEALGHFRSALGWAPKDVASWYGVAATLRAQREDGQALFALRRLIQSADNPNAPAVAEARREVAALEKRGVEEVAWVAEEQPPATGEQPVTTATRSPGSLTRHAGDQAFSERRYLAALEAYRKAWSDEAPDAVLAYKIGATFAVMNDHRQALAWWRRALAVEPGRELIARHVAVLSARMRELGKVDEGGAGAAKDSDGEAPAGGDELSRAQEALRLGDPATALFLVAGSDKPGAATLEAEARLRLGDFERAHAIYEEQLGADPDDRLAKGGVAEALVRMGKVSASDDAIVTWVGREGSEGGYKPRPETFLVLRRGEVNARLLAPPEPEE